MDIRLQLNYISKCITARGLLTQLEFIILANECLYLTYIYKSHMSTDVWVKEILKIVSM